MRVLLIAQYYPPDVGGASTRVSSIQRILLESGNDVLVVAGFPHYPHGNVPTSMRSRPFVCESDGWLTIFRTWVPSLPHNSVASRFLLYLSFTLSALTVLPLVRSRNYDVVWALSPNYFSMIPGLIYAKLAGVPVIHDVVDIWPAGILSSGYRLPKPFLAFIRFLAKLSYLLPNAVVALSDSIRAHILQEGPTLRFVWTIPNAVEDALFKIPTRDRQDGVFNVVYVGTLAPSNDFDLVLRAAERLTGNDAKFSIYGAGECATEISRQIKSHHLNNVILEAKPVRHDNVPSRLSEADALILPLKKGFSGVSFPSKLGEYLASGRPIICCAEGDLGELIRTNEIGLVVSHGSAKELADAVLSLKKDEKSRRELGSKARRFAANHFTTTQMAIRVTKLMQSLNHNDYTDLEGRSGGPGA